MRGLHPRQLHVFDDPDRDDRGWVLSVAHVEVVRPEQLASRFADTTRLVPVHAPGRLPYDHVDIITLAVDHIRSHYVDKPDPDRLLGDEFTLRELRLAHEAIAGRGAAARHVPSGDGAAPRRHGQNHDRHQRAARRDVPPRRSRAVNSSTEALTVNSRTRRHDPNCIAGTHARKLGRLVAVQVVYPVAPGYAAARRCGRRG